MKIYKFCNSLKPKIGHIGACLLSVVTLISVALAPHSLAAIQGERGESSTASLNIFLTISPSYQISGVNDIVINVTNRDEDVNFEEPLCIRGISGTFYTIIAQSGSDADFILNNADGEALPFKVFFRDEKLNDNADELLHGIKSLGYAVGASELNCGGQDSSALMIKILSENLRAVSSGAFSGTLVLTIGAV